MKRIVLSVCAAMVLLWGNADAQQYRAGIPWSQADQTGIIRSQTVPVITTETPDYAKAKEEDRINSGGRYRVGLNVPVHYDMNNSGVFTYLDNGAKIWRTAIRTPGALAIDVTFDKFNLPKGVAMYLTNANGKQLEGSFTYIDNTDNYSVPLIQGDVINIEVDIPAGIQTSDIDFIINNVCAYYRGGIINSLNMQFGDYGNGQAMAEESGVVTADGCHINAVCPPEAWNFHALKQTAAHIFMNGYVCSGNLINNTSLDCTPLFLTASHCDDGLGTTNTHFSSWKFYFNYEYANCNGGGSAPTTNYLTGAKFRARSLFNPGPQYPSLIGDFLLLELRDATNKLGNQYDAYLGGWDRLTLAPNGTNFIDFHHPGGDPKKLSVFNQVQANGTFNQNAVPNTHWAAHLELGGIEGGSSGSALFVMSTGRIIGDLSGGANDPEGPCGGNTPSLYSKISRNWDYPEGEGDPMYRLKDHLDPAGTNANSLNTYKVSGGNTPNCEETSVSINEAAALEEGITIYPNPSNGIVNLRVNLANSTVLNIEVVNITGARTGVYKTTGKVQSGEVMVDLSALPNGIYMLRISSDRATVGKKVVLNR
jgi:lysyl endopeptidase